MRKLLILSGMMVLVLSMFLVQGASIPTFEKPDCGNLNPYYDDSRGEWKCPAQAVGQKYSTPQVDFEPFCIEEYCPNADQSLCRCTKMKYPPNPTAATSIDDAFVGTSVTTLTGASGVTEDEFRKYFILNNDKQLEYRRVFDDAFANSSAVDADDLYLAILGKQYENDTISYQNQISTLNQSLNEERNRALLLEEELNQSKEYIEELKFNFTSEINQLNEKIRFSGITGFFIRMFN